MAGFAHLVAKEFKIIFRDRQALLLLFVMPMVFIFFLSLAMKQVFDEKTGKDLPVIVENWDEGQLGAAIASGLKAMQGFEVVERPQGLTNAEVFDQQIARAAMSIPPGFTDFVGKLIKGKSEDQLQQIKLNWEADPVLDAAYRRLVKTSLTITLQTAILQTLSQNFRDGPNEGSGDEASQLRGVDYEGLHTEINADQFRKIIPNPLQQNVPGWSLFAMFFIALPLSTCLLRERTDGTIRRLLSYPISKPAIILSKIAPYWVINCIQFFLMLAVGVWIVPWFGDLYLQVGRHPWHLLPITMVAAFASTSYGMLVSSLTRTSEQASAFGAVSIVIMAVLGGLMVPHFVMPPIMQTLGLFSPLYWGLQAYLDVLLREAEFVRIIPKLLILLLFALVCQGVALWKFKWI